MFISTALAQATQASQPEGGALLNLMPLILIFAIVYFLMIRPQQKKIKAHQEMIHSIKRGEKVVTAGGIIGKVVKVEDSDNILHVEIAPDVTVKINRPTISDVVSRSQPANDSKAKEDKTKTTSTKPKKKASAGKK